MTIKEAIDKVDTLCPNQYSEEIKVDWLSRLDYQIFNDIILTHEIHHPPFFPKKIMPTENALNLPERTIYLRKPELKPYSVENMAVPLLVKFPYDELYIHYLQMKIDEANKETEQYNNSAVLFGSYYENFTKHYNEEHMPIQRARWNMWG